MTDPLYNIGISAYKLAVRVASVRNRKARLMLRGQSRTLATLREKLDPAGGYIWVHAASLGEFEQGRPIIERIKRDNPQARILLTFFSPSGYEVRKNYQLADVVCYMPFDQRRNVKRFLDLVKPSMAIFVKYEFWGGYLNSLRRRGIPTYIVSAIFRPGQIFFRRWGGMFRNMLRCFTTLFVQDERSRDLLAGIGINNVVVAGDTRFDRVARVKENAREFPVIEQFVAGAQRTVVMGSSWPQDEELMIPYFNEHPDMKLIIAPHEFDHERLHVLASALKRPCGFYSQVTAGEAAKLDCLIIDSFGILSSLYRYGQVAYVGGGFGSGIHNINEAAVYGIPVVFGPKHEKFREATDLIADGGGFAVHDNEDFTPIMDRLLHDEAFMRHAGQIAGQYIASHIGATDVICDAIFNNPPTSNDQ